MESHHKPDASNCISTEMHMNRSDVVGKERNVGAVFVPVKSIISHNIVHKR